jgi:hypothetical protein
VVAWVLTSDLIKILPNFRVLAECALVIPKDTCEVERGFSIMKWIKDVRKGRMGNDTLEMLLMCMFNGPDLRQERAVTELLQRTAELWYNGKSAKSGEFVKRRVAMPELQQSEEEKSLNPQYSWGQSVTQTEAGLETQDTRADARLLKRKGRVASLIKETKAAEELKSQQRAMIAFRSTNSAPRDPVAVGPTAVTLGPAGVDQGNVVEGARKRTKPSELLPASVSLFKRPTLGSSEQPQPASAPADDAENPDGLPVTEGVPCRRKRKTLSVQYAAECDDDIFLEDEEKDDRNAAMSG